MIHHRIMGAAAMLFLVMGTQQAVAQEGDACPVVPEFRFWQCQLRSLADVNRNLDAVAIRAEFSKTLRELPDAQRRTLAFRDNPVLTSAARDTLIRALMLANLVNGQIKGLSATNLTGIVGSSISMSYAEVTSPYADPAVRSTARRVVDGIAAISQYVGPILVAISPFVRGDLDRGSLAAGAVITALGGLLKAKPGDRLASDFRNVTTSYLRARDHLMLTLAAFDELESIAERLRTRRDVLNQKVDAVKTLEQSVIAHISSLYAGSTPDYAALSLAIGSTVLLADSVLAEGDAFADHLQFISQRAAYYPSRYPGIDSTVQRRLREVSVEADSQRTRFLAQISGDFRRVARHYLILLDDARVAVARIAQANEAVP